MSDLSEKELRRIDRYVERFVKFVEETSPNSVVSDFRREVKLQIEQAGSFDEYLEGGGEKTYLKDGIEYIEEALAKIKDIILNPLPEDKEQLYDIFNSIGQVGFMLEEKIEEALDQFPEQTKEFYEKASWVPFRRFASKSKEEEMEKKVESLELGKNLFDAERGSRKRKLKPEQIISRIVEIFEFIIDLQFKYPAAKQILPDTIMADLEGKEREVIERIQDLDDKLTAGNISDWAATISDYVLLYERIPRSKKRYYPELKEFYSVITEKAKTGKCRLMKKRRKEILDNFKTKKDQIERSLPRGWEKEGDYLQDWSELERLKNDKEKAIQAVGPVAKKKAIYQYLHKTLVRKLS